MVGTVLKNRNCSKVEKKLLKCEEEYRHLVQNANSIILRMDGRGRVIFLNAFARKFFGYKDSDILGRSVIGTIVPPTDNSGHDLKSMISGIMANPRKYINNENENMLRTGERVYIAWTNKAVLDKNKRLKEVLCIGNNVTKIKKVEADRFESVVHELREGVVSCGLDWKIEYANISARGYLALPGKKSRSFPDIIFEKYSVSITRKELCDLLVRHKKFDIIRKESASYKALYLEAELSVLEDAHGDPANILILLRDVTRDRLEESLKQDFLELISHKICTPLAVIFQDTSMLKDGSCGSLNDKQAKLLDAILRKTDLLKDLVDRLLKFIEIDKKSIKSSRDAIDPLSCIKETVAPIIKRVDSKKVELRIDCPHKNLKIHIPKKYFGIVIWNLVDNAIKFNDKEKAAIRISVKKAGAEVKVMISDNGPGIPPEERENVFKKFYQVEKSFTGQVEGLGLGLVLAKRFVDTSGGKLDFRSKLGKGTTFIVTFQR